jgi:hypothetical protein
VPEHLRRTPALGIAYFGNRYLHHARADLAEIASAGATYVVHAMSEADLRWNTGTMRDIVAAGKEISLDSWMTPWALGGVFGGEAPSYAVMEHPEACQRDDRDNHLPALCPRHPTFRQLLTDWLDAVAQSGASICQWDEPHLARRWGPDSAGWACRCDVCQAAFNAETGRDMPREWDPVVSEFVARLLDDTVRWLVAEGARRGLDSSIVLLPNDQAGSRGWRDLASLNGVRYFGGTPYWVFEGFPPEDMPAYLTSWCTRLIEATAGTGAEPLGWIQAFSVPQGREQEIERGIEIMTKAGITSIAVWAYRACSAMSALVPDNPDLVWTTVQQAFSKVRTQPL